jgi:hypothetical protein
MRTKPNGPVAQFYAELERERAELADSRAAQIEAMSAPADTRLSIRLSPLEMARFERLTAYVQGKYPRNAPVGQKTVFLEMMDALEARIRDNARKSGKKVLQVTVKFSVLADGVLIERIDNPNNAPLPAGINQAPTSYAAADVIDLFTRDGWYQLATERDEQLLFEKIP